MTLWSRDLVRSHGKLESLYLHYQSAYGHQTWQAYLDGLLPIKLHEPLIMWSCKITWQPKIIVSALPQCLWPPNMASWWLATRDFHPCYSTLWPPGLKSSRGKLKPLYLHYRNIYGHKTRQDDDLPWVSLTHKFK